MTFVCLLLVLQGSPSPERLTITSRQHEAVRAVAAAYRGTSVTVVIEHAASPYEAFAEKFAAALRAAGMVVTMRTGDVVGSAGCPPRTGLLVRYGPLRSGAVNAIAEALIRSGVLRDSLNGCRVSNDDELTFVFGR